jgi:polynucleotide 5'-hydroxyl-kinase GRC3/NOL9
MDITPGAGWEGLMKELLRRRGTVLILGASDSGKSTLARYLIEGFVSCGLRAAFVDSDIGQSSLGLPGTISMKAFESPADLADFSPQRVFFIGALSPARAIPRMIEGTRAMAEAARAEGAGVVVVDTTGLVSGEVGRALKRGKVRALRPDHIVAIQRGEELEHILEKVKGPKVHRLRASRLAKRRSRPARIAYRQGKFASYMKGARTASLRAEGREFLLRGRPVGIKEIKEVERGTLIGLNRDGETAAVGVFLGVKEGKVLLRTPLRAFRGINRVLIGEMTL